MKKLYILPSGFALLFLLFTSCKKEGATVTKVINVRLLANSSFSYKVPQSGDSDDKMQITQQASHYAISKITESGNSDFIFNYTPARDYTGSDEIKLSNVEESHGGKGMHGQCQGHQHDDVTVYDFKITINGNTR